ncbi:glycosyltransferase family 2 protein [Mariniflexile sp. AS56]|uniref:glycosyltransferase family 2 protein n=1 Tax=Mariniflexile sp. AS56 TaxID=3063957 RepID=UPI0026F1FA80|nr:glycosyltransferase family A protein [Mariniflexile sp. AS56]MDO7172730.1 glycosyltransferase family A protein [Mariniflexile sp. AS56]
MNTPSNVTVVIPCYNDGAYVISALHSVLNQTLKPERVIIIDDGSKAETRKILETIQHENVDVVFQENNGVCMARNFGIGLAKTDFILNLDADDYFEPSFIEKAVEVLNGNLDIAIVGCYYKKLKGTKISNEIIKPLGGSIADFLVKNNAMNCSLFRKKCWEQVSGYDENMSNGYEDWDFWISILKNGWYMHIIKEPLFIYRVKTISRDSKALENHDSELRNYILNKHKQVYLDNFESFSSQLLYTNHELRKNKLKVINSLNYKLGSAILAPLRFLKKHLGIFNK